MCALLPLSALFFFFFILIFYLFCVFVIFCANKWRHIIEVVFNVLLEPFVFIAECYFFSFPHIFGFYTFSHVTCKVQSFLQNLNKSFTLRHTGTCVRSRLRRYTYSSLLICESSYGNWVCESFAFSLISTES